MSGGKRGKGRWGPRWLEGLEEQDGSTQAPGGGCAFTVRVSGLSSHGQPAVERGGVTAASTPAPACLKVRLYPGESHGVRAASGQSAGSVEEGRRCAFPYPPSCWVGEGRRRFRPRGVVMTGALLWAAGTGTRESHL